MLALSATFQDETLDLMSRRSLGITRDPNALQRDEYTDLAFRLYGEGSWEPCTLSDWSVDRANLGNVNIVGNDDTSYQALLSWQAVRFPEELRKREKLSGLIFGPGDLFVMGRVRSTNMHLRDALGSKLQYPKGTENRLLKETWEIYGLGDKVYANLVNILYCFLPDPDSCPQNRKEQLKELRRYLALFLLNQIEGGFTEGTTSAVFFAAIHQNLPGLYDILLNFKEHHSQKQPDSTLLAGGRFPREHPAFQLFTPELLSILKEFLENSEQFMIKNKPTIREILMGSSGSLQNFILGKFESTALPRNSIHLGVDVKSMSHLTETDFEDVLRDSVGPALKPGGVQIGDGIRESYSGDHRVLQTLRAIHGDPSLSAGVIVESHPDNGDLTLVGSLIHRRTPIEVLPDLTPILAPGRTQVLPVESFMRDHRVIAQAVTAARIKASMRIEDQRNRRMMRLFYGTKGQDIEGIMSAVKKAVFQDVSRDVLVHLRTDPNVTVTPDLFDLGPNRHSDENNPVRVCVKAAHAYLDTHLQSIPAII